MYLGFHRSIISLSGGMAPAPENRKSLCAAREDGDPSELAQPTNSISKRDTMRAIVVKISTLANRRPGQMFAPPPKGKYDDGASRQRVCSLGTLLCIFDVALWPELVSWTISSSIPDLLIIVCYLHRGL